MSSKKFGRRAAAKRLGSQHSVTFPPLKRAGTAISDGSEKGRDLSNDASQGEEEGDNGAGGLAPLDALLSIKENS